MGSISEQISWHSLRQNTSEQIMSASVEGLPVGQWMRCPQTQEDCSCFKGAHTNYMPENLFTVVNPGVIHAQYVINIIFTFNLSFLGTCPQVFFGLTNHSSPRSMAALVSTHRLDESWWVSPVAQWAAATLWIFGILTLELIACPSGGGSAAIVGLIHVENIRLKLHTNVMIQYIYIGQYSRSSFRRMWSPPYPCFFRIYTQLPPWRAEAGHRPTCAGMGATGTLECHGGFACFMAWFNFCCCNHTTPATETQPRPLALFPPGSTKISALHRFAVLVRNCSTVQQCSDSAMNIIEAGCFLQGFTVQG